MVYFIDSNIFIRVLELENKKVFEECSRILDMVRRGEIKAFVSNLVLSEIVWVLGSSYKEGRRKIIKSLTGIRNLENLDVIDNFDTHKAIDLYSKHSVKFIDSLIASIPQINSKKMTVISYDKDFDKLGVSRIEPNHLINQLT